MPGVPEVFANLVWLVIILINEDLPTLERPINAYSGLLGGGQPSTVGLLIRYVAERISIVVCTFAGMQSDNSDTVVKILPDAGSNLSKKAQVAEMFNNIAGKYDFLNHFLSMGIDKGWRKKAIREVGMMKPKQILDVATGTGDLAIAAADLQPDKITGIDIATQMLDEGRKKIAEKRLDKLIQLQEGDSEALQFADNNFDIVMCAYGVRNFEHLEAGLKEMNRVLRKGGKLVILEFSHPKQFQVKQFYQFYFKYILPFFGKLFSKHSRAYTYLPESVMAFPEGKAFCDILSKCGYTDIKARPLTFGVTTLYTAFK